MKRGNIVEFRRKGFTSSVLGRLLKLFDKEWDGWGWHLAIAWQELGNLGWYLLEATSSGVEINFYYGNWLEDNTRSYNWFSRVPTKAKMEGFLQSHLNKQYDVAIYFWTMLQYLVRHWFNHRIPRLLDNRFTCWELVTEFCEEMGKPIISKYDCPMISDVLKNLANP